MQLIIDHVQIAAPEGGEARAREFFVGVLGMVEEAKPEKLAVRGGCWFRLGECVVHVGIDPDFRPQRKGHPAFAVSDIEALAQRFESSGYAVRWDSELEGVSRFYSVDPFGNRLEFIADGQGLSQQVLHEARVQRVVPTLRVRSYDVSRAFYARLGFEEKWKHQFEPRLPVFASVARDGMELFLTEHEGDCQFGGLVHFYVPDVDSCYRQFRDQGIAINEPPSNSLGPETRDMLVVDPDGNRLSFVTLRVSPSSV